MTILISYAFFFVLFVFPGWGKTAFCNSKLFCMLTGWAKLSPWHSFMLMLHKMQPCRFLLHLFYLQMPSNAQHLGACQTLRGSHLQRGKRGRLLKFHTLVFIQHALPSCLSPISPLRRLNLYCFLLMSCNSGCPLTCVGQQRTVLMSLRVWVLGSGEVLDSLPALYYSLFFLCFPQIRATWMLHLLQEALAAH